MNAALTQLWTTRSLADCGQFFSGGTPNRSIAEYWGGTIPWISAKSLKTFRISDSEERVTESGAENGTRVVPSGTLLFVVRGMSLAKEFRVAVTTGPVTFNQDLRALVPSGDVDPVYLTHFLRASEEKILGMVDHASHGTTRLTSDRMDAFEIPIPPLAEQRRIAGVLDRAEALRTKRRATLAQLNTLTRSIFFDLFGDPVTNSRGWQKLRLADVLAIPLRNGLSPSSAGTVDADVLTLSAVTGETFDERAVKTRKFMSVPPDDQSVSDQDLLICRGNGNVRLVGKGYFPVRSMTNVTFPDTIIAARISAQRVERSFLQHVWNTAAVRRQIESMARTTNGTFKVNQTALEGIEFVAPPLIAQREFARRITAVEKLKSAQRASLAELDALFASLQHRAFRGEL